MMRKLILSDADWQRVIRCIEKTEVEELAYMEKCERNAEIWARNHVDDKEMLRMAEDYRKSAQEARRVLQVLRQAEILPETEEAKKT